MSGLDVAIVAPCAIPYTIGGAENLVRWLQDHFTERTEHQCEVFKIPSREYGFWSVIEAYERFAAFDLTGFDVVVSMKYPAWMVSHRRHVLYLLHPLRNLYDLYPDHLALRVETPPRPAAELLALMEQNPGRREVLDEVFDRLDEMHRHERTLPSRLFEFPGPFLRTVVRWLDGVGQAPTAIHRYGALSARVTRREGYLPAGVDATVVHPPTGLQGLGPATDQGYLLTASRLEEHKRVGLVMDAMAHVPAQDARLIVAGGGPQAEALRAKAARDPRIEMVGRVSDARLAELYAGSRGVVFAPKDEDYGLISLEAMLCGRPVITTHDSGGPTELVDDGVTGFVVDPDPSALGAAMTTLITDPHAAHRMGEAGLDRGARVRWGDLADFVVS